MVAATVMFLKPSPLGKSECWSSSSTLQLAFELVEESPIGTLGDDPVGVRLDHARLTQAQCVEAERVFGIVLAPLVIGDFLERLQRVVIPRRESAFDQAPCSAHGIAGAEIGRFEDGAQRPLRSNRILVDQGDGKRQSVGVLNAKALSTLQS